MNISNLDLNYASILGISCFCSSSLKGTIAFGATQIFLNNKYSEYELIPKLTKLKNKVSKLICDKSFDDLSATTKKICNLLFAGSSFFLGVVAYRSFLPFIPSNLLLRELSLSASYFGITKVFNISMQHLIPLNEKLELRNMVSNFVSIPLMVFIPNPIISSMISITITQIAYRVFEHLSNESKQ